VVDTAPVAAAPATVPAVAAESAPPSPDHAMLDVELDSVPAGAKVLLGGVVLGKTPFRGTLPRRPGDAALVIRLEGYADRRVPIRSDAPVHERIKLVRAPVRPNRADRDKSVNPFAE
jgi:hypothetical protein